MRFSVVTIFPEIIWHYAAESILGRAEAKGLLEIAAINLRDFAEGKHKSVDDTPYGGGPGMIMRPEPMYKALEAVSALKQGKQSRQSKKRTILLSPRGRQFDQRIAEEWTQLKEITFVCGRYEGVDQRVSDHMVDEEISIGPYVLAGGELGALVIIEAVARLLPGVLGNEESLKEETHGRFQISDFGFQNHDGENDVKKNKSAIHNQQSAIEYPHYTKPVDFMGWKVPEILLSGNHEAIRKWRKGEK